MWEQKKIIVESETQPQFDGHSLVFEILRFGLSATRTRAREHAHTHAHTCVCTLHCPSPAYRELGVGFVGAWKRPRKMFSDKLFTVPFGQSVAWRRVTPRDALHLLLSLLLPASSPFLFLSPPSLIHSFTVPFPSVALHSFLLPHLFSPLCSATMGQRAWPQRPPTPTLLPHPPPRRA